MARFAEKYKRRRLRSAYISVVVSISLVLFVLGLFGTLVSQARTIAKEVKENFAFTVILKNDASQVEVKQFQKELELADYVKSTEYISKEEAAENLQQELDEDFVDFLDYNPLHNALDIRLNAPYVENDFIANLEQEFLKRNFVLEVVYDKPLIQKMNENIEQIGLFLLSGSVLLAIIAIALINSSIRLSIYSSRFLIKTMQLVGATKAFVRKPFIRKSIWQGIWGALVASALLGLVLYYAEQNIPGLEILDNYVLLAILFAGLLASGLLISMSCTFFALSKYLKLKPDQLYF